ncbi:MAG: hypothetical protein SXV54_26745, partial [Chloroflexota bacterium]|nr:hypothetical protein [Chloroflexota bacterium]
MTSVNGPTISPTGWEAHANWPMSKGTSSNDTATAPSVECWQPRARGRACSSSPVSTGTVMRGCCTCGHDGTTRPTGRFLTKDPFPGYAGLPQTQHAYVYVGNNLVNLTDPGGEVAPIIVAGLVGGGIGAVGG